MVGKKKIENWSDRLLVWYRLRVPVVHPTPKFLKSPPPHLPSGTSPRHAPFKETLWTKKKKEGKYGAYRKRTPANSKCF